MACEDCRDSFDKLGEVVEQVHAEWTCGQCGKVVFDKAEDPGRLPVAEDCDRPKAATVAPRPGFFASVIPIVFDPFVLIVIGITAYQITALFVK